MGNISKNLVATSIILITIGFLGGGQSGISIGFMMSGIFILALLFVIGYGMAAKHVAEEAFRPIPDAFQIAAQLRIELNREPTLQEVAAAHQILTSNHNQALIGLGAILVANHSIQQNLNPKK